MKHLFAYIRVSTVKQGDGVSLQEQRAAIERYAARTNALITEWFEEQKSAAKAGRPEFARMVKLLRRGKADGVVMHKIDRSARNFRDWADIDDVISSGIDVFFANEDIDLRSRGGRLVADMQMVVAVDYIRNLREETLKGIHGRLKQGILPHQAPIGYLDTGAGNPKAIDPVRGPLLRHLFELYGTGRFSVRQMTVTAADLGLRNSRGNLLRVPQIHAVLRNSFYAGLLVSRRFGTYLGAHEPVVSRALFDQVQEVLSGKAVRRTTRHAHRFRRLLRCKTCHHSLTASRVKGHVYYRCTTITCPSTCIREERIETAIIALLQTIDLSDSEVNHLKSVIEQSEAEMRNIADQRQRLLAQTLSTADARLQRLTALLVDGTIDAESYAATRENIVHDRNRVQSQLAENADVTSALHARSLTLAELLRRPHEAYMAADDEHKRLLLKIVTFNRFASGKNLDFAMREPFAAIANRGFSQAGTRHWNTHANQREDPLLSPAKFMQLAASFPQELLDAFTKSEGESENTV